MIFIKNIEEYNPSKKRKILIVYDNMIADILSNKKLNPVVTELFIKGRKLNISLVFITKSHFSVPKNKRELEQIAFNHSSDIDFQDFLNRYKNVIQKHILFWLLILLLHQIILHVLEKIF